MNPDGGECSSGGEDGEGGVQVAKPTVWNQVPPM